MKRLTEKNDVGSYYFPKCFEKCNGLGASSKCDNCENMTNVCEKLGAYEDDESIICPYCGKEYEPSYEDTYIGNECVDCYTEDTHTFTCDNCGKKFTMYGYQAGWKYHTETIDGEATEEEIEDLQDQERKGYGE